jgi:MazG family protein
MAEEDDAFVVAAVVDAIAEKMIRRHPHVFGDAEIESAKAQTSAWEQVKAAERAAKGKERTSILDDIPLALPALTRAEKLQKRAARVGFDWPAAEPVLAKIEEEIGELRAVLRYGDGVERARDEFGDLLFALANLGRHLGLDPEEALRSTNRKFDRRFRYLEQAIETAGRRVEDATLDELEELWQAAKTRV